MEMFFGDDSECAKIEASEKGYREDVIVYENGKRYNIAVYSMKRLYEDFILEKEQYGYFQVPTNLIIVEDVNEDEIKKTINRLQRGGFFEKIKENDTI